MTWIFMYRALCDRILGMAGLINPKNYGHGKSDETTQSLLLLSCLLEAAVLSSPQRMDNALWLILEDAYALLTLDPLHDFIWVY